MLNFGFCVKTSNTAKIPHVEFRVEFRVEMWNFGFGVAPLPSVAFRWAAPRLHISLYARSTIWSMGAVELVYGACGELIHRASVSAKPKLDRHMPLQQAVSASTWHVVHNICMLFTIRRHICHVSPPP